MISARSNGLLVSIGARGIGIYVDVNVEVGIDVDVDLGIDVDGGRLVVGVVGVISLVDDDMDAVSDCVLVGVLTVMECRA